MMPHPSQVMSLPTIALSAKPLCLFQHAASQNVLLFAVSLLTLFMFLITQWNSLLSI